MSFCGCEGWLLCAIDKGREDIDDSFFHPRFLLLTDQEIYFFDKAVTTKEARAFGGVTTFESVDDGVTGSTVPISSGATTQMSNGKKRSKRKLFSSKMKIPSSLNSRAENSKKEFDHIPSVVPLGQALVNTNHPSVLGDSVSSFPELFSIYYLDYRIMFWCNKASTRAKWVRALSYVTNTNGITFQRTTFSLGFGNLHKVMDQTKYRILISVNGFIEGKSATSSHVATSAKSEDICVDFNETIHLVINQWLPSEESGNQDTIILIQTLNKRGRFVTIARSNTQNADWSGSRRVPRIRMISEPGVKHGPSFLEFEYKDVVLTILAQSDYHGVVRWFEHTTVERVLFLENICKNSSSKTRLAVMNEAFFLHLVGAMEHKIPLVFSWLKTIIIAVLQEHQNGIVAGEDKKVVQESSSYGRLNGVMDGLLTGVIALYGTPWLQTALSGLMDEIHEVALRYGKITVYGLSKTAIEHSDALIELLSKTWKMIHTAQRTFPAEARKFLFNLGEAVREHNFPRSIMNLYHNQVKTAIILRFITRALCDPFDFGLCSYKFQQNVGVAEWCKELSKSIKVLFFKKVIREDRYSDDLMKFTMENKAQAETFIAFCQSNTSQVDTHWAINNHFDSRFSCANIAYQLTLFKRVIENDIASQDINFRALQQQTELLFPLVHQQQSKLSQTSLHRSMDDAEIKHSPPGDIKSVSTTLEQPGFTQQTRSHSNVHRLMEKLQEKESVVPHTQIDYRESIKEGEEEGLEEDGEYEDMDEGERMAHRIIEGIEGRTPVVLARYFLIKQSLIDVCRQLHESRHSMDEDDESALSSDHTPAVLNPITDDIHFKTFSTVTSTATTSSTTSSTATSNATSNATSTATTTTNPFTRTTPVTDKSNLLYNDKMKVFQHAQHSSSSTGLVQTSPNTQKLPHNKSFAEFDLNARRQRVSNSDDGNSTEEEPEKLLEPRTKSKSPRRRKNSLPPRDGHDDASSDATTIMRESSTKGNDDTSSKAPSLSPNQQHPRRVSADASSSHNVSVI
eukprot:m.14249 g.14249  ORF g.14249 m.14249 type:complete len:1022 (-) comp4277_c0_seq1:215-3280(-)